MPFVKTLTVVNGLVQGGTGGDADATEITFDPTGLVVLLPNATTVDEALRQFDAAVDGKLDAANDLSDLNSASTALENLGLSSSMTAADLAFAADDEDSFFGYDASAAGVVRFPASRVLGRSFAFQARLTVESGVAVSTTNRTAQSTLYLTPYKGNRVTLYDGTRWNAYSLSEIAIVLSGLTNSRPYDVWAFASSATPSSTNTGTDVLTFGSATGWATGSMVRVSATGGGLTAGTVYFYNAASSTTGTLHTTLANALAGASKVDLTANITDSLTAISLELLAWTNDTTRATALATQSGNEVKSGDATRLYVGTIYTTSTTATEDSVTSRYVWNNYNRVKRSLRVFDETNNWTYNVAAYRAWNNSTANRVNVVIGLNEDLIEATAIANIILDNISESGNTGIGIDSVTVNSAQLITTSFINLAQAISIAGIAHYTGYVGVGRHYIQQLEYARLGTVRFDGDGGAGAAGGIQSGLTAMVMA